MDPNIAELEKELKGVTPVPPEGASDEGRIVGRWAKPQFQRRLLGAGAAVALVTLGLIYYYHGRVSTDDAQVDGHITPVASKIYGNVAEVLVNDNQQVKAGQVMARIDARDYQVKVGQAQAALALAQS